MGVVAAGGGEAFEFAQAADGEGLGFLQLFVGFFEGGGGGVRVCANFGGGYVGGVGDENVVLVQQGSKRSRLLFRPIEIFLQSSQTLFALPFLFQSFVGSPAEIVDLVTEIFHLDFITSSSWRMRF